jgi:hypothetical protein
MKFFTAIFLTVLLGYAAPLYFSWWSFAITSLIVAVAIHQKPTRAFSAGFFGLLFLWGVHALLIDIANEHILSQKIATLLPLGGSSMLLILVTAFIGGVISGFAALTGSFARRSRE